MKDGNPIPIPIRYTGWICFIYGLQIFSAGKKKGFWSCYFSKCFYGSLIGMMIHAVQLIATTPEKVESATILLIFLSGAMGVYVFLRRNISKIERVFYGIECHLSEKDLIKIQKTDKWINVLHLSVLTAFSVLAVVYFVCNKTEIKSQLEKTGPPLSDAMVVVITVIAFVYHMKVLYGIIACSIMLYSMTMVVFECMGQNLKRMIRQTLVDGPTVQSISLIRTQLRIYWNWKQKADKFLNVFPFIWAAYVFLTFSLVFTKLIFEWHTENQRQVFLMINMFSCLLIIIGLALKWHLYTAPDKTLDKCMQLVFSLTDPRTSIRGNQVTADAKLHQEILSLHLEIGNAPNTHSTILGAVRLNFKSLISYIGALVNFSVMIISIRMAVKN